MKHERLLLCSEVEENGKCSVLIAIMFEDRSWLSRKNTDIILFSRP